jgi:colanic acid/amylovoran biosynthesis protein
MPAKILVINLHSYQNAGDASLSLSAIRQLQHNFPNCELTLAINDPDSYRGDLRVVGSFGHWLQRPDADRRPRWHLWSFLWLPVAAVLLACSRWAGCGLLKPAPPNRRDLLEAYCTADLVVSSPGGYLYSSGKLGLSLAIALYAMGMAWVAGKPLYLLPQSIGPLRRTSDRWLVGRLLRRARLVMVREAISLAELPLPATARANVYLIPDMAVSFPTAPREEAERWLAAIGVDPGRNRPLLGVTAINWQAQNGRFHNQQGYEQALAAAARFFVEELGGTVIFFPQVCGPTADQDDRVPAHRVATQLAALGQSVWVVEHPPEPALLKSVYGLMDAFIGTRMHSNIFAVTMLVPTLAIGYLFKTRGIARTLGIEQWVVDIDQLEGDVLVERLRALWAERDTVRAGLSERVPGLVRDAERAGAMVAADYAGLRRAGPGR